jgi:putative transcriptional regulator
MDDKLILKNNLHTIRKSKKISQDEIAKVVGTTRQTIISIEKGIFNPSTKLALLLCIALDTKFEEIFYF